MASVQEEYMSWVATPIQPVEYRECSTTCINEHCYLQQDVQRYVQGIIRRETIRQTKLLQDVSTDVFNDVLDDVTHSLCKVDKLR